MTITLPQEWKGGLPPSPAHAPDSELYSKGIIYTSHNCNMQVFFFFSTDRPVKFWFWPKKNKIEILDFFFSFYRPTLPKAPREDPRS